MRATALDRFIDGGHYHEVPGESIPWDEFLAEFRAYCKARNYKSWPEATIIRDLGPMHPVGRATGNKMAVGNIGRHPLPRRYVQVGKQIRLQRDDER